MLIVINMTFSPPATITFSGDLWYTMGLYYTHISNGLYDLTDSSGSSTNQAAHIEFTDSSGVLTLDVNPSVNGGSTPAFFNNGSGNVTSGTVAVGDTITLKRSDGATRATFTLPNFYSGDTNTEDIILNDDQDDVSFKKVHCNFW